MPHTFNYYKHKLAFSLIEIMVVIAIIGLIASFAIPSYLDHVHKSKVTVLVSALSSMQRDLTEQYMLDGHWPATLNGSAVNVTSADTTYDNIQSFRYDTSTNKAWYGYKLNTDYGNGWIFMVLIYSNGSFAVHCGSLSTDCTLGSCDSAEYYPDGCNETDLSTTYSFS